MIWDPPILDDTEALWLLDQPLRSVLRLTPLRWLFWRPLVRRVGPISAFIAIRSRYAEDELEEFIVAGGQQYVILGAGLDSWALRNTKRTVTVYELDHPDTQATKANRILAELGALPAHLVFVPIDFETDSIDVLLGDHGYEQSARALVSWLGTICYLTRAAIGATLNSLRELCKPGSRLVFDYFQPRSMMSPEDLQLFELLDEGGSRRGEPMKSLVEPQEIADLLHSTGFRVVEDLSAAQIRERYLAGRSARLGVPGFARLCCAERSNFDE